MIVSVSARAVKSTLVPERCMSLNVKSPCFWEYFFTIIAFVKVSLVLFMIDLFCWMSHYIIVIVSISGDRFESRIKIEL